MVTTSQSTGVAQSRRRAAGKKRLRNIGLHILLIAGSFIMLAPFAVMLLVSLFPKEAFFQRSFDLNEVSLQNYFDTFTAVPFARFYFNSLVVAISTTFIQILTASLAAFAFARLRFKGRDPLFLIYLATLMIPFQVTMIPNFILVRELGWYNSYLALILPGAFSAFSTFLLRQYYLGIPKELDEAARMDGASSFRIWLQIIVPLSGPVLATLAIFNFLASWNDFLWPLVITNSESMRTIPVGLSSFQGQYSTEWHLLMAGSVIALLPVLAIYILAQKWFVQGITLSGMGGR
ncbi:MAG: carbohydrate ABC transporter permease [Chloroflexota bacterium]|nr:carbohydrate ABC transporter permease [Chloroflexota bacterium]